MERERYIDITKGLAILCITLLHYESGVFPQTINIFIGSFMITMFYVASGWLSAQLTTQRTFKQLVKKRWHQLGIPYLWWTCIILLFDLILFVFGYYDLKYIGQEVYKTITLRGIGTLWFLPALFGGEMIWYWLRKQVWWIIVIAFILTICYQWGYGFVLGERTETIYRIIDAPFHTISNILYAWVGIAAGYYFYRLLKPVVLNNSNLNKFIFGFGLCVIAFFTANYFPVPVLWAYIAPLIGPLGFLFVALSIQNSSVLDYFDYWGRNSLILMVTHYSITIVICRIIVERLFYMPFDGWITLVCFAISMIFQYLIIKPINMHAKFLLGK